MTLFPRPPLTIDVERGRQLTLAECLRPSKGKA